MPDEVVQGWEDREGPIILTTVNKQGIPNAIYASCVSKFDNQTIIIADNYFQKTKENILSGSKAALLFRTKNGQSFQAKGDIEYFTEGKYYENMKTWNPSKHPGNAAAAFTVKQIFSGSKLLGGEELL